MSRIIPPSWERRTVCEILHLDELYRRCCEWPTIFYYTGSDEEKRIQQENERKRKRAALQKRKKFTEEEKAARINRSEYRKWKAQRKYQAKGRAALKFQSMFRSWKARRDFTSFMTEDQPPLTVVQRFCHLLKPVDITIQEIELNMLKKEVYEKIEATQQQRQELSEIEKDVPTVEEGCITLYHLVSTFKKLKSDNREDIIKAITKKKEQAFYLNRRKQIIASYENLFYYLQTEPVYLSRLIGCLPIHSHERRVLHKVLARLYDYVSSPREQYHLMNLMKATLHAQIQKKCEDRIPYGELMILKTITRLYGTGTGYRDALQATKRATRKILSHTALLTPSYDELTYRVLRLWNAMERFNESLTGKAPIKKENSLFDMTDQVVMSILSSSYSIPYGVRYTARILQQSLQENLPGADEDAVWNTVGTFLYNWLRPAIEDPHAFGLGSEMDLVQKENLRAVSELIHMTMNPLHFKRDCVPEVEDYMKKTTPKFRRFYRDVIDVPEPEEYFKNNRFSEATAMEKSVIQMPAENIIFTHVLLTKYAKVVFPDKKDVVYQVLESIQPVPKIQDLLDLDDPAFGERTEIDLQLSGKFHPQEDWDSEMENLLTTTRKLIVDVIRVQPGETVHEVLTTPATPAQEKEHKTLMRDTTFSYVPSEGTNSNLMEDHHLPLKNKKKQIHRNMEILRESGLVENKMKYESLLNQVSKEIKMKHELRKQRETELTMLRKVTNQLSLLSNYLRDLIDMNKKHIESSINDMICQQSHTDGEIQYSANELFNKGVIMHTWGKRKDLKREVLTIKVNGGNIQVQLGNLCKHVPVLDLLKLYESRNPTMKIFHYDVNANLFLFLVCSKIFKV